MKRRWIVAAVVLLVLLVQAPARHGEFLDYDDNRFIVVNEHLDEVGNPLRFFTSLDVTTSAQRPTSDIYRPLRTLAYAALTSVFDRDSAAPFHWASILFHVVASMLLVLLLFQAGVRPWIAGVGAAVFGIHPVVVETTAWACSLGDAMCGAFALWAVLAHARDRTVQAVVALVLALFAKEHAVIVPGLWFAWDYALRPERLRGRSWRRVVPGLLIVIGFLWFRGSVLDANMSQVKGPLGGSWPQAVLTMLAGLGWYASCLLFPSGSTFLAVVPTQYGITAPAIAGVAVLAALVYGALRGSRLVRLGCLWFLIGLVPVSNLFVTLKIPTADRFLYLPLMGLMFLVADLAARTRPLSARLAAAPLVLLALLCVARIGDWKNDDAIVGAWQQTNRRQSELVWKDGASWAKKAFDELRGGDALVGGVHADRAVKKYVAFFQNAPPSAQLMARIEAGDLLYEVGRRAMRTSMGRDWQQPWSRALEHYVMVFQLQRVGRGRVIAVEMRHVANRIVKIGIPLAQPFSPSLKYTIEACEDALRFLKNEHGRDGRYDFTRLLLSGGITNRAKDPAGSRRAFNEILRILDELQKDGIDTPPFQRAQAIFYRAILEPKNGIDVPRIRDAIMVYARAVSWCGARKDMDGVVEAVIQQAEARRVIATHGGDSVPREERIRLARAAIRALNGLPGLARENRLAIRDRFKSSSQGTLSSARATLRSLGAPEETKPTDKERGR